jgi:hypothetical protein
MRALLLTLLLALPGCFGGGCGPDDPNPSDPESTCLTSRPAPPDGKERVELGVVVGEALVPLAGSSPLLVERGPQGGQHFFVSLERYAATDLRWRHVLTLTSTGGEEQGGTAHTEQGCAPGWTRVSNILVFLGYGAVEDGRLRVASSALDDQGLELRTLTAEEDVAFVR